MSDEFKADVVFDPTPHTGIYQASAAGDIKYVVLGEEVEPHVLVLHLMKENEKLSAKVLVLTEKQS